MTDQAPPPNRPEDEPTAPHAAAEPQPAPPEPAAPPQPAPAGAAAPPSATPPAGGWPPPRSSSWRGRRVPLLAVVAALLAGCVLGAGVVAAGAIVTHFATHHDHGPVVRHDHPFDRRPDFPRDGHGRRNLNPRPAPTATAPTPVPGTSS